jgi:hypothetical protein
MNLPDLLEEISELTGDLSQLKAVMESTDIESLELSIEDCDMYLKKIRRFKHLAVKIDSEFVELSDIDPIWVSMSSEYRLYQIESFVRLIKSRLIMSEKLEAAEKLGWDLGELKGALQTLDDAFADGMEGVVSDAQIFHEFSEDSRIPAWLHGIDYLSFYRYELPAYIEDCPEPSGSLDYMAGRIRIARYRICRAFRGEKIGALTENLLKEYFFSLLSDYDAARELDGSMSLARFDRAIKGKKTGHAAFQDSWLNYWNDAWLQRRSNGKGWLYSTTDIINSLPVNIPVPSTSTVRRYRTKLAKKLGR